jgi:hypothetical protein
VDTYHGPRMHHHLPEMAWLALGAATADSGASMCLLIAPNGLALDGRLCEGLP